jgi:hypothetical protein
MVLLCVLTMAGCGGSTSASSNGTATPTFSPGGGTYTTTQSVTIADATPGATLYCTTDGTTPTTSSPQCSEPTIVSKSMYLQAIAVASGKQTSAVASAGYTITLNATASPTFSPVGGTYTSAQTVTLSDATSGAQIYYTTDGTTPTVSAKNLYTGPITVSQSQTLNAIAVATGYNNSGVASTAYVINYPAAKPTFSVAGGSYTSIQTVQISDTTPGATIYYTTDSTIPSATHGTVYSGPIIVSSTQTLAAVAVAPGYSSSDVASATYTVNLNAATPTFSVPDGTYNSPQSVTLNDTTSGVTIYYTLDGTTPTLTHGTPVAAGTTITVAPQSGKTSVQLQAVAGSSSNGVSAIGTLTLNYAVAEPVFTVVGGGTTTGGMYTLPMQVTIGETTPGATVYYIVGTSPDTSSLSSWTAYTSGTQITIPSADTLNAIAVEDGYTNSSVNSATFSGALSITGSVVSGTKGIAGAKVYLYAAGTSGYGASGSVASITSSAVTTDTSGKFTLVYGSACPASPGDQLFLVATGGDVGNSGNGSNDSIALMTALGTCGNLQTTQTAVLNEATTIASVYALQQFMGADSGVEGGLSVGASSFNSKGLMSAFNTVGNLVDVTSGNVWGATVNGTAWGLPSSITWHAAGVGVTPGYANGTTVTVNGTPTTYAPQQFLNDSTVPASRINTLANILATCVDAAANCAALWDATKTGSLTPANTLEAALNIATNPGGVKLAGGNLNNLWTLSTALGAAAPYTPALGAQPNDFTLVLTFTSAGLGGSPNDYLNSYGIVPQDVAIDADGSILAVGWTTTDPAGDGSSNMIVKFNNLGLPQTPATVESGSVGNNFSFKHGGVNTFSLSAHAGYRPGAIAIDASGYPWIYGTGNNLNRLSRLTPSLAATDASTMEQNVHGRAYIVHSLAFDSAGNLFGTTPTRYWEFEPGNGGYVADSINWYTEADPNNDPSNYTGGVTFDSIGDLWVVDSQDALVLQLATNPPLGVGPWVLQSFTGTVGPDEATGVGANSHVSLAADSLGHVYGCGAVTAIGVYSASGQVAPATQTGRCGQALAVDGDGHLWSASVNDLVDAMPGVLDELSYNGSDFSVLSPSAGYTGTGTGEASAITTDYDVVGGSTDKTRILAGMAIDGSGNLWVLNHNTGFTSGSGGGVLTNALQGNMLVEYVGLAAPVTTPKAVETANTKQGKRP